MKRSNFISTSSLRKSFCVIIASMACLLVFAQEFSQDKIASPIEETKVVKKHNKKDFNARQEEKFKWVLREHQSGKVSVIVNNEVIIPESLGAESAEWKNGYFIVRGIDGHVGAYDMDGNEVISPEKGYTDILDVRLKPKTILHVRKDSLEALVDLHGNEIVLIKEGYESAEWKNGYFIVRGIDGHVGAYDMDGNEVISPEKGYTDILKVHLKPKTILHVKKDSLEALVDPYGNEIVPIKEGYDYVRYHESDNVEYVSVRKKGEKSLGLYNLEGELLISPDRGYEEYNFREIKRGFPYIVVKVHNHYSKSSLRDYSQGLCDLNGNEIISPKRGYFDFRFKESKNYIIVEVGEFKGACDLSGKEIIAPYQCFTSVYTPSCNDNYFIVVSLEGNEGLYDKDGKEVISPDEGYVDIFVDSMGEITTEKARFGKPYSSLARKSLSFDQIKARGLSVSNSKEVFVKYGDQYFSTGLRSIYYDAWHTYVDLGGSLQKFEEYGSRSFVYNGALYTVSR